MKYLIIILLSLFLFQASYTQEVEIEGEIGEAFFEEEAEAGDSGWIDGNLDDFNNDEFSQEVLRFGSQWVISQLIGYNSISNSSSWNVTQVNWVQGKRDNGINYKINALYENDEGEAFIGEFVINTDRFGPMFRVLSVTYALGDGEAEAQAVDDEELIFEENEAGVDTPPITPATFEELFGGVEWLGAWSDLDPQEAQSDATIQDMVNAGADFAIHKGLDEGILPTGNWKMTTLDYVKRQFLKGAKYAFTASFSDGDIKRAQAQYFVFQNLDSSWYVLTSGFYSLGLVSA